MQFVHPDTYIATGPQGCWTVPMTRPRVMAIPRLSDRCDGLTCNATFYPRLDGETIDATVERIALLLDDGDATYTLRYAA